MPEAFSKSMENTDVLEIILLSKYTGALKNLFPKSAFSKKRTRQYYLEISVERLIK